MTDADLCAYVSAIEAKLPQDAYSARLALSLIFGEVAGRQVRIEKLEALVEELEKRPRFGLIVGGLK